MKLITFQSYEALKSLINNGYLECDDKYIDINKMGVAYKWVLEKMQMLNNDSNATYPIWAWVKCYNTICPPRRKGKPVDGFDVKITFNKDRKDVFITDFRRYSFILNNMFIPNDMEEKEEFDKLLKEKNITLEELKAVARPDKYKSHRTDNEFLEVCHIIRNSFARCITEDSDILQGCVWKVELKDVEKIEILNDKDYIQGSLNYIRTNGKRIDWCNDFYTKIK